MTSAARERRQRATAAALSVLACAVLLSLASARGSLERVSGDEGTYLAMAESLAEDFDLEFDERDEARVAAAPQPGRRTVILQRTSSGVSYSKPVFSALIAAPMVAVLGDIGFVTVNLVLLAMALGLLWVYLKRVGGGGPAALTVVTVAAAAVLVPYALWKTSDILQASLAMAGLTLGLGGLRDSIAPGGARDLLDRRWAPWTGAVLLALLVTQRPPYALIAACLPLASLLRREWRRAARLTGVLALTLAISAAASWLLVGTPMPYKAERATFNVETGYPAGGDAGEVSRQFETGRATSSLGALPAFKPRVTAFASLYFLVGRHTGVLIYFPAAFFLIAAALRSADRVSAAILIGVAATCLFFLLWLPFNYFGGGSCVGNRYFLVCYAALPLALGRPLERWSLAGCWLLAMVVGGSALASERLPANADRSSQSHVHAGIFRLLPYETTGSDIEGSRDRYFGKDFVRSVDPFVEANPWSFRLRSDLPAAEFVLANLERGEPLRLLVHSGAKNIRLEYRDYARSRSVPLPDPVGVKGLVEIQPSLPRRYHPLWFRNPWDHGKPYWVRVFRLAIRGDDGAATAATVRFLGNEEFPPPLFERTVVRAALPESVLAGSISRIPVRVRNDNHVAWRSGGLFPVYLSYRLEGVDGQQSEGGRTALPAVVRPSGELNAKVEVRWPQSPGTYRAEIDLVAEGVAWFASRSGAPLASGMVEVVAGGSKESP